MSIALLLVKSPGHTVVDVRSRSRCCNNLYPPRQHHRKPMDPFSDLPTSYSLGIYDRSTYLSTITTDSRM